jgi:hypothetical protein
LVKKFELDIEYEYDFLLFGIVSTEKPYRLAWQINQVYPYDFERINDYQLELNDKPCSFFTYRFTHEENHTAYFILSNKDDNQLLLPDLKNFDYLVLISGATDFFDTEKFKDDLNSVRGIQLIYSIDVNTIKSKQNLMYLI